MTTADLALQLTAPGAPFEVATEDVGGFPTLVFKQRLHALAEVAMLAGQRGEQPFLTAGGRTLSCAEFVDSARSVSAGLAGGPAGVRRGDRVAVLAANCAEWCQAFWGTVGFGGVLVGLNGWWKADEILYGLQDSGSVVAIMDGPRYARVADRLDECTALEVVYLIDGGGGPASGHGPEVRPFSELLSAGPSADGPGSWSGAEVDEDDPAVIFYTSGTTGKPKGAISTHRSMIANLQNTLFLGVLGLISGGDGSAASMTAQQVSLLTSPLFHVSGCHSGLVVGLAVGSRIVIPTGRFDPEAAMATIEREKVTVWAAVPTMIWRVVDDPRRSEFDLSSVRTVAYGGSPSAGELRRRVTETFPSVSSIGNAYGLTETSSVATVCSGEDAVLRPASVGRPMPVVEVKVVDPMVATDSIASSAGVVPGEVGEICVAGSILMAGYWGKPKETAEVLSNGWLRTGDLGYLDEDGFLFVTDRAKDMIIRGGENVYCVEIEERLVEHPGVAEAAVVGVPHPTLGEEVKAIVVPEPGATLSAGELQAWVAEILADFKVPAYVEIRSEALPRNASGKLLKPALRGLAQDTFEETF